MEHLYIISQVSRLYITTLLMSEIVCWLHKGPKNGIFRENLAEFLVQKGHLLFVPQ